MLRTVLLLRHGKSNWDAEYGRDRERPLAPRGVEAAKSMGRFLAAVGPEPDRVLSSPAVRARTTAELAAEAAGWGLAPAIEEGFYGGGAEAVLDVVRRLPGAVESALLVGHEPVWSGLVSGLAGGGRVRFPTAALACLTADSAGWESLDWGRMELRWLVTPKLLKRSGFDA